MSAGDPVFLIRVSHRFYWIPKRRKDSPLGWGVWWLWWFFDGGGM